MLEHMTVALVSPLTNHTASIVYLMMMIIVETLQIGFSQSTVVVHESEEMVTLTIELNQNAWITEPVTVTYSTSQGSGVNAASKLS